MTVTATKCAHCKHDTYMDPEWGRYSVKPRPQIALAATCASCGKPSVAYAEVNNGPSYGEGQGGWFDSQDTEDLDRVLDHASRNQNTLRWYPQIGDVPVIEDVPEHIARAAKEAYSSAGLGNFMAAILMARTVIEATAKDRGVSKGDLASKINKLRDEHGLSKNIADQAHEVRFAGNDMAHGDIQEQIDAEDANEILALMAAVLNGIFQEPARLEAARAKRTARKAGVHSEGRTEFDQPGVQNVFDRVSETDSSI